MIVMILFSFFDHFFAQGQILNFIFNHKMNIIKDPCLVHRCHYLLIIILMLCDKNLLKPLVEEFLIKGLDLSTVDEEKKKVPIKTFVVKNKEGKNVIYDANFSIEVNFEEEFLENFLEKHTATDIDKLILNDILSVNKFRIEIYLEKDNRLQMLIEEFDILPAINSNKNIIPPNINTDSTIHSLTENIIKQTKLKDIPNYNNFEVFNCSQGSENQDVIITEENLAHIDLSKILIESNNNNFIKENPFLNENSNTSRAVKVEGQATEKIEENSNKIIEESPNPKFDQQDINRFYHIFENNNVFNNREENQEKRLPDILVSVKEKYKDIIPHIKKDVVMEYMKLFQIIK